MAFCFAEAFERRQRLVSAARLEAAIGAGRCCMTFFELGVEDADRGRVFYEGLFGWRFEPGAWATAT